MVQGGKPAIGEILPRLPRRLAHSSHALLNVSESKCFNILIINSICHELVKASGRMKPIYGKNARAVFEPEFRTPIWLSNITGAVSV